VPKAKNNQHETQAGKKATKTQNSKCRWTYLVNQKTDCLIVSKSKIQQSVVNTNLTIKVAGYSINTQKSVVFLCTNNEQSEKVIGKPIPFIITSKN
jgi:hypothetical protein